jgi:hypothetical protein
MTLPDALRADSCTFPSYTLALHKRAANEIESLARSNDELTDRAAEYEAELARAWEINEKLLRLLHNNQEALELTKDIWHSTQGQ